MKLQLVGLCLLVIACDPDRFTPDVGPPLQELCLDEDSDEEVDVSFSNDIAALIFALPAEDDDEIGGFGCDKCHRSNGETPLGLEVGGLDLATYSSLRSGGLVSGSSVVVPGRPCDSVLLQKIKSGVPFGARMPLDGPPYVDEATVALLHDWIAEGARDN